VPGPNHIGEDPGGVSMRSKEGLSRAVIYFVAGLPLLALAKAKNMTRGYVTPRSPGWSGIERSLDYDIAVAKCFLDELGRYGYDVKLKDVLELGPGPDLGVGYYVLYQGARSYTGFDVNPLIRVSTPELYEMLRRRIEADGMSWTRVEPTYVVRKDFDLQGAFKPESIDIVFSQFAFEHFDHPLDTVRQLRKILRPGGIMVAQIDLKTHSRWIRDRDPLNIYRYPDWLYDFFHFPGQPNRIRPWQYRRVLEADGWTEIRTFPGRKVKPVRYAKRFREQEDEMECLTVTICATRRREGSC